MRSTSAWCGALLATLLLCSSALAQEPTLPPELRQQAARSESERGQTLFAAGDYARALDAFQASRRLFANKNNTLNAAICMENLGRPAEALALYDEARRRFAPALRSGDAADIEAAVRRLGPRAGSLLVRGVAGSALLIDGVERGRLPLDAPLWLPPGAHVVRVLRQGFIPFEARADTPAGEASVLDARQEPLASSGALRVEADAVADILVDGATVGPAPWEGLLSPGTHLILARGPGGVSAPFAATVLAGQTTLFRARLLTPGASLQVRVEPASAALSVDGVPLGVGSWEGPLPAGVHVLRASEPGYRPVERPVDTTAAPDSAPLSVSLALEIDPAHPRWPRPPTGRLVVSLEAGAALAFSLRSDAEASCPGGCFSRRTPLGALALAALGYETVGGWQVGAQVGVGVLWAKVDRVVKRELFYDVRDELRWRSWWVGPRLGRRLPLGSWSLTPSLALGVGQLDVRDAISVTARSSVDASPARLAGGALPASALVLLLRPGLSLARTSGPWSFGASLGALYSLLPGPRFERRGDLVVDSSCAPSRPAAAACAADSGALRDERAASPFGALSLALSLDRAL